MAKNYKILYEQTMKVLEKYQDELVPGFRKQIDEEIPKLRKQLEELEATVVHQRKRADIAENFICTMCDKCEWEVNDGILIMQKACCAEFPECEKFKLRSMWIPVSQGLPNFSPNKWKKVFVTMEADSGNRCITTAIYNEKEKVWYAFAEPKYKGMKVVAWMMKPEVYNG